MKVAYVINVDFAMLHFLLPLMQGARARGHTVIGICAEGPLLKDVRAAGFRVIPAPLIRRVSPLGHCRALGALIKIFRAERPHLVHAHMPISGLLARVAARVVGVPKIAYTCHGFLFNQPGPWPRRAASLLLEWLGGRLTDVYFTVSQEEAQDARRLRIARGAIAIGNGRDPLHFQPDSAARKRMRAALNVGQHTIVVIFVARLVRHKGLVELLAAMEAIDANLWVVGSRLPSDRGPDMESLLLAAPLGRRLQILGQRDDVPMLLAAADIFALPSHFEGLPMSIIEAMMTGLPVVATDISGPRELVVAGETGILVSPGTIAPLSAALRVLVNDASLRARMGAAGRERAKAYFNEMKIVAGTLNLLAL